MSSREEQLVAFLKTVPTGLILSEAGRRNAGRRKSSGAPKVVKPCRFCRQFFGAREMRVHLAAEHPGGLRAGIKPKVGHPRVAYQCKHCPEFHGRTAMRTHVQQAHPELCRPKVKREPKFRIQSMHPKKGAN